MLVVQITVWRVEQETGAGDGSAGLASQKTGWPVNQESGCLIGQQAGGGL